MSFPYLDLAGVQLRSVMRPSYFTDVEALTPGFTVQSIATNTSPINSQMRKRYGGNLPWGQQAPPLVPAGLAPPAVTLVGRPTLGSYQTLVQITLGGALGTATFQWSSNNGVTWTTGVLTAASVALGATGMSALFPAGPYDVSNVYAAAPPVPETILQWLTALVTDDVSVRHGINPNDPLAQRIGERVKTARAQIEEAANTKDGLWDLPQSEDAPSAIDTGGPRSYSEQSPYEWARRQQIAAYGASTCRRCGCAPCVCSPFGLVGG
jgi:hypothetical protein